MPFIPFYFPTRDDSAPQPNSTHVQGFVKLGGTPSGDTSIFDADFASSGYMRLKVTSALHLIAECSVLGSTNTLDINAGAAVATGTWYWVEVWANTGSADGGIPVKLSGRVSGPGGITSGSVYANLYAPNPYTSGSTITINAKFSLGKATSTGYNNWPNSTGWELTKFNLMVIQEGRGGYGGNAMPTVDYSVPASNITAYWKCRDTLGAQSTIVDSSGNGYDLTGTFTVVTDGPYP